MKCLLVNTETHDIERNNINRLSYIQDKDAKIQRIWLRLRINRGEWFLDESLGVPWFDLFDSNASVGQIRAEVQNEILRDEYVKSVDYVKIDEVDKSKRKLVLSFSVLLDTGESATSTEVVSF